MTIPIAELHNIEALLGCGIIGVYEATRIHREKLRKAHVINGNGEKK